MNSPQSNSRGLSEAILRAADSHFQNKNLTAARDFLALLDHCQGHTPETLQTLGNVHFLLGEYAHASSAFERAVAEAPDQVPLWIGAALTYLRLQDACNFERCLTQAIILEPQNVETLKLLADMNLGHGYYLNAAGIYEKLIDRHPNQVEVLLALAKCRFQLGDASGTQSALECVLRLDPANEIARENLAVLKGKTAEPVAEGRPGADPTLELPPQAAKLLACADAAYAKGDLPAACGFLRQSTKEAPEAVPLRVCLANICFQLGQFPEALEEYLIALALQPDTIDILVRLAATALRCNDIPRFEQALGRALELNANDISALRLLADLNFQEQRFADASEQYHRIHQQTPQDTQVLLLIGRCEFETGHWESACQAFQQALDLDPSLAIARENLQVASQKAELEAAKEYRVPAKVNGKRVKAQPEAVLEPA